MTEFIFLTNSILTSFQKYIISFKSHADFLKLQRYKIEIEIEKKQKKPGWLSMLST